MIWNLTEIVQKQWNSTKIMFFSTLLSDLKMTKLFIPDVKMTYTWNWTDTNKRCVQDTPSGHPSRTQGVLFSGHILRTPLQDVSSSRTRPEVVSKTFVTFFGVYFHTCQYRVTHTNHENKDQNRSIKIWMRIDP